MRTIRDTTTVHLTKKHLSSSDAEEFATALENQGIHPARITIDHVMAGLNVTVECDHADIVECAKLFSDYDTKIRAEAD